MRTRLQVSLVFIPLLIVVCGCTPLSSSAPSTAPSASPSEAPVTGLPPGCEVINLQGPTGDRIVLDGQWVEVDAEAEPMTWWIRTQGNCVWGSGQVEDVRPGQAAVPWLVQSLNGVIGSDFVITGEILLLGPTTFDPRLPYSPLRMLIEFDDAGEVLLREDRESGGPRCPDPSFCPDPLVLQRAD